MAASGRTTSSWSPLHRDAVVAIGVGFFGLGVAVGGYGAFVTLLIERGIAPDAAGLGMTLFLLGQVLIVIPADRLSRAVGVEVVTALGLFLGAVGIVLGGWVELEFVYLSRLLLGLGQGMAFIAGMKYVGLGGSQRPTAMSQGLLGALFTLGLAVGLASVPTAVEAFGTHTPMLTTGLVSAIGGILTLRLPAVQDRVTPPLHQYIDPFVRPSGLVLGLGNMAAFGFLMVAATWYTDVLEVLALPVTATLVGFAIATVIGRAVGGWLARQIGERGTVFGALALLTLVLGGLSLALSAELALPVAVGLIVTGLCFGIPFGPLFSLAFSEITDDGGVTVAGMFIIGNGGALIYPWLVGLLLVTTAGYEVAFSVMAATVGVITVLWLITIGVKRG